MELEHWTRVGYGAGYEIATPPSDDPKPGLFLDGLLLND